MHKPSPDISVIIVAWNDCDLLVGCLRSLKAALEDIQAETIVVDNGSVDRTAQVIRKEFSDVGLIVNPENVGFTRGNNLAFIECTGRYVMLLNADTVVFPDTVDKMVRFMDSTPDAGIAGCKQTYPDGEWQPSCHRMITLKREAIVALGLSKLLSRWVDYGDLPLKATEPFCVDWVGGACLIARRDLVDRVGLLDENIFIYGEDVDLCQRVRDLGYSVYYLPTARIIHYRGRHVSRSSKVPSRVDYSKMRLQFIGRRYVIAKHYGTLSGDVYHVLIVVQVVRKLLQDTFRLLLTQRRTYRTALKARRREYLIALKAALKGQI